MLVLSFSTFLITKQVEQVEFQVKTLALVYRCNSVSNFSYCNKL